MSVLTYQHLAPSVHHHTAASLMEEVLSTPGSGPHSPEVVSGCGITAHTMEKRYLEVLG